MRVLVCGSREWTEQARIYARLSKLPDGTTILHGTARGADRIAASFAEGWGFEVEHWPANWKRDGKKAGILRNIDMLDSGVDLVLAFWDGASRGTLHTIREAQKRGIHVEVNNFSMTTLNRLGGDGQEPRLPEPGRHQDSVVALQRPAEETP